MKFSGLRSLRRRVALLGVGAAVVSSTVTALSASGCSRDYESNTIYPLEGGPAKETGGGDVIVGASCPSEIPVDPAKLPWKPPTAAQDGKCQADDVAAMRQFLTDEPNATNEEFAAFVKNRDGTCHDCIFADGLGATWPPAPLQGGKVVTFNVGACYAILTGLEACGHAVQNEWDCEFDACAECTSQDEQATCRGKSRLSVCKPFVDDARAKCVGAPSADDVCGGPFDSIRVQCVTSSRDAGKL